MRPFTVLGAFEELGIVLDIEFEAFSGSGSCGGRRQSMGLKYYLERACLMNLCRDYNKMLTMWPVLLSITSAVAETEVGTETLAGILLWEDHRCPCPSCGGLAGQRIPCAPVAGV
jgi:hypothetical protein